jgi:hypothetical protein
MMEIWLLYFKKEEENYLKKKLLNTLLKWSKVFK